MEDPSDTSNSETPQSRLDLLWEVLVFQAKLAVDGLRDLVLVPISLFAALAGLLVGGKDPDQYFRRVLNFGRRTEDWINLFGHRASVGTSDEIIKPFQDRVFEEANNRPWLKKTGSRLNSSIDTVGKAIKPKVEKRPTDSDDS